MPRSPCLEVVRDTSRPRDLVNVETFCVLEVSITPGTVPAKVVEESNRSSISTGTPSFRGSVRETAEVLDPDPALDTGRGLVLDLSAVAVEYKVGDRGESEREQILQRH